MGKNIKIILASPPDTLKEASHLGYDTSHMIYRVGQDRHLYRADLPLFLPGNILSVDDAGFQGDGPVSVLSSEIVKECTLNRYTGVVLDVRKENTAFFSKLTPLLLQSLEPFGIRLYVPEWLFERAKGVKVLISTFMSTGTLQGKLRRAIAAYGAENIAADIPCSRMSYTLPVEKYPPKELSLPELTALSRKYQTSSFFSKELYAYYFTYTSGGKTEFVLYDNVGSIRRKLALLQSFGIREAFLLYPEVSDWLDDL